jgi:hypothetical protein
MVADTTEDAPTADVPNETVKDFLDDLNRQIREDRPGAEAFSADPVTRDAAPKRRNVVDPANPPSILSASRIKIVNAYEGCVEADELAAAAALRRRDGLNDQRRLATRLDQFVLGGS